MRSSPVQVRDGEVVVAVDDDQDVREFGSAADQMDDLSPA